MQPSVERQPPAGGDPQLVGVRGELAELAEAQRVKLRQGSETKRLHAPAA